MNYIDIHVIVYWLTDDLDFGETATNIFRGVELTRKNK